MAKNSMRIGFELTNFAEMRKMLEGLPASAESRVMGDAVKVAAKPIVAAVKARTPRRSGALRRSISAIVKRYPKAGKVMAIIGPDKGYYGGGKRLKKGESRQGKDRPANYAHLVEFGHKTRGGGSVPARSFLRAGVATATQAAERQLSHGIEVGMQREIKRGVSKLKRIRKLTT